MWYLSRFQNDGPEPGWPRAPRLIEDRYSVTDAVVVGSLLISLLRHADRVAVACVAQLVNAIALIMTEPGGPAWRQTTFHPFAATSRYASGDVLRPVIDAPTYETKRFGDVPLVDAVATNDDEGAVLFVVNRSLDAPVQLTVDTRPLGAQVAAVECLQLADADRHASNTAADPDRVRPRALSVPPPGADGEIEVQLPPISWTMVRLTRPSDSLYTLTKRPSSRSSRVPSAARSKAAVASVRSAGTSASVPASVIDSTDSLSSRE